MKLYCRTLGEGPPLVILHGLYGASDNWLTIAHSLTSHYMVILPDLRNHGQSPHDQSMGVNEMANDILELTALFEGKKIILMGHSLGGKVAMWFALKNPHLVEKLVVVDIAPKSYATGYSKIYELHKNIVAALKSINTDTLKNRGEAEKLLTEKLGSAQIASFLLKNLKKETKNQFSWKLNLDTIHRELFKLINVFENQEEDWDLPVGIPTLFIKGEKSGYLDTDDLTLIQSFFKGAKLVTIEGAGHWVHADKTEAFLDEVSRFLSD